MGRWTKAEVDALKECYSKLTMDELLDKFPGHTAASIYSRAYKLGLRRDTACYTSGEEEIIAEYGGKLLPREIKEYLPGRTVASVANKLCNVGVTTGTRRRWTDEEDAIILSNLDLGPTELTNKYFPYRTVKAVAARKFWLKQCGLCV